jgi:hypothetical protein
MLAPDLGVERVRRCLNNCLLSGRTSGLGDWCSGGSCPDRSCSARNFAGAPPFRRLARVHAGSAPSLGTTTRPDPAPESDRSGLPPLCPVSTTRTGYARGRGDQDSGKTGARCPARVVTGCLSTQGLRPATIRRSVSWSPPRVARSRPTVRCRPCAASRRSPTAWRWCRRLTRRRHR